MTDRLIESKHYIWSHINIVLIMFNSVHYKRKIRIAFEPSNPQKPKRILWVLSFPLLVIFPTQQLVTTGPTTG